MAVVDVWAEINGQRTKLNRTSGDIWSVTAPSDCPDGSYTCAFWAVDEAGNIGYKTAILWIFDGRLTCIKWIEDKYRVKWVKSNLYSAHALPNIYSCHYVKQGCPIND